MKKSFVAIEAYAAKPDTDSLTELEKHVSNAYSKIDKAVKRKVLHANNGARKKARLAKALKNAVAAS